MTYHIERHQQLLLRFNKEPHMVRVLCFHVMTLEDKVVARKSLSCPIVWTSIDVWKKKHM